VAAVADLTGSVRVLVVDDDPLVRAAITMILGRAPGVEMVGEAADGLRCSQRSTGTSRTLC
jgi:chemotaxis response regulator CheB